jgi:hypothetical protein
MSRTHLVLASAAFAAVALVLVPADVLAQLPNFTKAEEAMKATVKPLFQLLRYLLVGFCIVLGLWEAFKASRGQAKGWFTAILLFIVAGIALGPAGFFNLIGMNQIAVKLVDYGL